MEVEMSLIKQAFAEKIEQLIEEFERKDGRN